jgi:hypothetical protein
MELIRERVQYPFAALLLLASLSCAEYTVHNIYLSDLARLRMGMGPDEPPRAMGVPPKKVFQWSTATTGDSIIVQSYRLVTGEYGTTYFLAYRNDSLIFWGYPQEFARSSDPLIREIGKAALSGQSLY